MYEISFEENFLILIGIFFMCLFILLHLLCSNMKQEKMFKTCLWLQVLMVFCVLEYSQG